MILKVKSTDDFTYVEAKPLCFSKLQKGYGVVGIMNKSMVGKLELERMKMHGTCFIKQFHIE